MTLVDYFSGQFFSDQIYSTTNLIEWRNVVYQTYDNVKCVKIKSILRKAHLLKAIVKLCLACAPGVGGLSEENIKFAKCSKLITHIYVLLMYLHYIWHRFEHFQEIITNCTINKSNIEPGIISIHKILNWIRCLTNSHWIFEELGWYDHIIEYFSLCDLHYSIRWSRLML